MWLLTTAGILIIHGQQIYSNDIQLQLANLANWGQYIEFIFGWCWSKLIQVDRTQQIVYVLTFAHVHCGAQVKKCIHIIRSAFGGPKMFGRNVWQTSFREATRGLAAGEEIHTVSHVYYTGCETHNGRRNPGLSKQASWYGEHSVYRGPLRLLVSRWR